MQLRALILAARHSRGKHLLACAGAVCAVLFLGAPALATSPGERLWATTYRPASGGVTFTDVAAGADGAVYVTGSKRVDQSRALILLKCDVAGRRAWAHAFRGDYQVTFGSAVGLDARGNAYVGGGYARRHGEGGILLAKYAPDGTCRWLRAWNPMHSTAGWSGDGLASMAVDRDGNVYLAVGSPVGWSDRSDGLVIPGLVLAKYDARGKRLWAVRYRDPSAPADRGTMPHDLALDGEGDVYVACAGSYLHEFDDTWSTALTLKFSGADGSLLASAAYTSRPDIDASSIDVRDSTVAVSGQGFVVNYDLSLRQRYAATDSTYSWGIAVDAAGNTVVTGWNTLLFASDGTLSWQQAPGFCKWVRADDSGDSYVGGQVMSGTSTTGYTQSVVVTRFDGSGETVWTRSWPDKPAWAAPSCFTLGPDGVYIGGRTGHHGRAMLIKYAR